MYIHTSIYLSLSLSLSPPPPLLSLSLSPSPPLSLSQETESDVADMKAKVSSCQSKGKHIKDVCHHDDRNKVDTKLEELNASEYIPLNNTGEVN